MLKRLAILSGLAIILANAVIFVTCKYQAPCQSNSAQNKGNVRFNANANCVTCRQKLLAWPEGITVWAVLLTLLVIGWQSWETSVAAREMRRQNRNLVRQSEILERQTKAAEDGVRAALAQSNYLVASERAWIAESINFPDRIPRQPKTGSAGLVVAIIALKNIGKQVAFLRSAETRFHMGESLPDKPAFRAKEAFDDGYMLVPQETLLLRVILEEGSFTDEDADQIERRLTNGPRLYLYGRIVYDTTGCRGTNSFCYTWQNLMGFVLEGDKPHFLKKGPKGYNQHI